MDSRVPIAQTAASTQAPSRVTGIGPRTNPMPPYGQYPWLRGWVIKHTLPFGIRSGWGCAFGKPACPVCRLARCRADRYLSMWAKPCSPGWRCALHPHRFPSTFTCILMPLCLPLIWALLEGERLPSSEYVDSLTSEALGMPLDSGGQGGSMRGGDAAW